MRARVEKRSVLGWNKSNAECPSGNFGDSSQLKNWILDSGATCHMTTEVSDFITGSLEDTDKHTEVTDRMCNDNGYPFIATLHNVILAPYLCDRLF